MAFGAEAFTEAGQQGRRQGPQQPMPPVMAELLGDQFCRQTRSTLGGLEGDITKQAIADDDLDLTIVNGVTLYITTIVDSAVSIKKRGSTTDDVIALVSLFAVAEQGDPGSFTALQR